MWQVVRKLVLMLLYVLLLVTLASTKLDFVYRAF